MRVALAQDLSEGIQGMYAKKLKLGPFKFRCLYAAACISLAGLATCYIALGLLVFVILGRVCQYTFFQRHLRTCHIESRTTSVDVFSDALANCSEIAVYHDAYNDISSIIWDQGWSAIDFVLVMERAEPRRDYIKATRTLVEEYGQQMRQAMYVLYEWSAEISAGTTLLSMEYSTLDEYEFRQAVGKMAYVWELLGTPNHYALTRLGAVLVGRMNDASEVLETMQVQAGITQDWLDQFALLATRLSESAQHGLGVIESGQEQRTKSGYVYAHVPCGWTNLCGLLVRPKPLSQNSLDSIRRALQKLRRQIQEAVDAIGTIRAAVESNRIISYETKQALDSVVMAWNTTRQADWKGDRRAIVMEAKHGRARLRERTSDLLAIRKSFKIPYRQQPPPRPVPNFQFPLLRFKDE
ncbi:hypothetical protein PG985_012936 [Apiospora marii]|uniref:uncharacterized protein n=1 Tax=Apiospora marii TaxID=335849 RepID=UPI00312E6151